MTIPVVEWPSDQARRAMRKMLQRPAIAPDAEVVAREMLQDVRQHGARAIARYALKFDGVHLTSRTLRVPQSDLDDAWASADPATRRALRETDRRVRKFAHASMKKNWQMPSPQGGVLGERFVPFDRVGAYIPGGAAPLVSTALMTVSLARAAGVPQIVACTPSDAEGRVNASVLASLRVAGATEVYRVGGIPAIGLMAYGTRSIPSVQKIVGPGNAYVTAAKRCVYGDVALDLVAGPSEIAILADENANPVHIAADLLSQAEHGSGREKVLLVTVSRVIARATAKAIERLMGRLSRTDAIRRVLRGGALCVVVPDLETGMALCNEFAPEHFELLVRRPRQWLKRVRAAGAVFLGPWTPEAVGDFVAGPSHVLPTGGAATMFAGLTVEDFRRRQSFMSFTRADLAETLPTIEKFGEVEGLDAHALSARIRFESS